MISVLTLMIKPIVRFKEEIINPSAARKLNCLDSLIWLVITGADRTNISAPQ